MTKILLWMQYLRSVLLALRIIAFEKTDEAAAVVWSVLTLPVLIASFFYSPREGLVVLAAVWLSFFVFRNWARRNRYRLIRTADRVEFADAGVDENDYRQRFLSGVVLRRMGPEDVKRSGEYDTALMEGTLQFFLIRSSDRTKIVPSEQIVGIELETQEG